MNIPDAAIEAAAPEIQRVIEGWMNYDDEDWVVLARAAIEAAMPAIREAIAQEIDLERVHYEQIKVAPWGHGMHHAARIVRAQ